MSQHLTWHLVLHRCGLVLVDLNQENVRVIRQVQTENSRVREVVLGKVGDSNVTPDIVKVTCFCWDSSNSGNSWAVVQTESFNL